jgi:hypothetical protein
MNRNRNILAHELTLALEDEPVRLRGNRQLSASTDQKLVSLAQSRCPTRLVAERDLACEIALLEQVQLLVSRIGRHLPSNTIPASSNSYLGGDAAGPFSIRKYAAVRGFLMPLSPWLPNISACSLTGQQNFCWSCPIAAGLTVKHVICAGGLFDLKPLRPGLGGVCCRWFGWVRR